MQARCPSCSAIFPTKRTGLQFCPGCGEQVMVADMGDHDTATTPPGPGAPPPPGFASAHHGPPPPPAASGRPGMGAPPPPGSPALNYGREPTPWERRAQLGFFPALWATWKETVITPETFWKRLRPDGPAQDALLYGWMVTFIGALIQAPLQALQLTAQSAAIRDIAGQVGTLNKDTRAIFDQLFSDGSAAIVAAMIFAGVVIYPATAIASASVTHLFCVLFGAARNGFWATFRVMAYGSAPMVLAGIPVLGAGAVLWSLILIIWGIREVHDTTAGRATAAVLAVPVILCCCCCGALTFGFSALMASFK